MSDRTTNRVLRRAAVALTALAATGCATRLPTSEAERAADAGLAARVEQALLGDSRIYARHVDVDAERGIVRLSGFVYSGEDLYEARRVAATVPGVLSVSSELELIIGGRQGSR